MHRSNKKGFRATVAITGAVALLASMASADVVIDWNNVLIQTIRDTGGPPCPIGRSMAMTHVAIYDAVNSINPTAEPYLQDLPAPAAGASAEAAAAAAGHRVLSVLFPAKQADFDAALVASLANVPDGPAEDDGVAHGVAVANAIIAARANDGTQTEPNYPMPDVPGQWRPTFPDFTSPPFNPGWGGTVPWTMVDGSQFRPRGPLNKNNYHGLLHSKGYAQQVNEIKSIGALNSTVRTEEQTRIAFFWANDVNGTYKPPGHLNYISQVVSQDHSLTLEQNARLFALINLAMADAGLVAWDAKYRGKIDLWRPISAIREADSDGNHATIADPNWEPLNPFTPPFPAWISGHATFGAAHAAVMADFFGTDNVTFTIDSEDPFYQALPSHPLRTFSSFSSAAWENAESRLWLGVHYRFDATDGNAAGTALGHYVYAHHLQLSDAPAGGGHAANAGHAAHSNGH